MDPSTSPSSNKPPRIQPTAYNSGSPSTRYPTTNFAGQYQLPSSPPPQSAHQTFSSQNGFYPPPQQQQPRQEQYMQPQKPSLNLQQASYNPSMYPPTSSQPNSPPPNQTSFSPSQFARQPPNQQFMPPGYIPPPPPRGPPPLGPQQTYQQPGQSDQYGYGSNNPPQQRGNTPQQGDPWAGLNAWK